MIVESDFVFGLVSLRTAKDIKISEETIFYKRGSKKSIILAAVIQTALKIFTICYRTNKERQKH